MTKVKFNAMMCFLVLYFCTLASSCNDSNNSQTLQEGDLLFQNLNCGELCDAIESVTEGVDGKDFSHCAMVVRFDDTLKVVEAIGDKVQINSINNFFARSGDTVEIKNITIGRVKHDFDGVIQKAVEFAKAQVGKPYDNAFLMENGSWYCSELLYQSFKEANNNQSFFDLAPMTFKDPNTNDFFPAWIDYYKDLNTEIPEGKTGINPGLISRSNKIKIIEIKCD
jgi:hypothetical protein